MPTYQVMKEVESGQKKEDFSWFGLRSVCSILDRRLAAVLGITVMVKIFHSAVLPNHTKGHVCVELFSSIYSPAVDTQTDNPYI